MSTKKRKKPEAEQQLDPILRSKIIAEKVKFVWLSMTQMFGERWREKMGGDPLGEEDPKNRNDMWCDSLERVQMHFIRQAVNKVRSYDVGNDPSGKWWLPSLPQFLAFAGYAAFEQKKPEAPKREGTWIETSAIGFTIRWTYEFSVSRHSICDEDMDKIKEAMKRVCEQYNSMIQTEEIPKHFNAEVNTEIRTMLARSFARIRPRPASDEEIERRLAYRTRSATSSPTRETSSSSTPHGPSTLDEQLNFD